MGGSDFENNLIKVFLIIKYIVLTILLFQSYSYLKSEDCFCETDSIYNEYINCEPKILDNGAKIYWSFNCDSSWLTFENNGNIIVFESFDKEWMDFTGRLGYVFFQEFNNSFLYESKRVSGCCQPTEFFLHDKTTGELIKELGTGIYFAQNSENPFFVSINYEIDNLNYLLIFNFDTKIEYNISIPSDIIKESIKYNNYMFPEYVFQHTEIIDDTLLLYYHFDRNNLDNPDYVIKIDLKQYR